MTRAGQIVKGLIIAFAAIVGLAFVSALIWWISLPRSEGRTVYYWFQAAREGALFRRAGTAGLSPQDIEFAFQKMGPRGIYFLIAKLELDKTPKPLPPLIQRYESILARFELGRRFLVNSAREDWFTADRLLWSLLRRIKEKPELLLPMTRSLLKAPDPRMRAAVLQQLQRFGPGASSAVKEVTEALDDPYIYVRVEAAKALGAIGRPAASALERLNAQEHDRHDELVRAARAAQNAIRADKE